MDGAIRFAAGIARRMEGNFKPTSNQDVQISSDSKGLCPQDQTMVSQMEVSGPVDKQSKEPAAGMKTPDGSEQDPMSGVPEDGKPSERRITCRTRSRRTMARFRKGGE